MLGLIKAQRKLVAGVSAGLIVGVGTAVAFAAIPDPAGVIHACYRNSGGLLSSGQLRVIDDATQACSSNETAITWNQTGPQGPAGPSGPAGPGGLVSDLVGANFSNASLQYRNLTGLDLSNASFLNINWRHLGQHHLSGRN